ncbi:MAG: hypothetical protein ACOWWH_12665 [Eubacteriaceae bacterium]
MNIFKKDILKRFSVVKIEYLHKKDFENKWCFKADMVKFYLFENNCVVVEINKKKLGLNGRSVDLMKIKSFIDSKYFVGGDIGHFINYGLNMKK